MSNEFVSVVQCAQALMNQEGNIEVYCNTWLLGEANRDWLEVRNLAISRINDGSVRLTGFVSMSTEMAPHAIDVSVDRYELIESMNSAIAMLEQSLKQKYDHHMMECLTLAKNRRKIIVR